VLPLKRFLYFKTFSYEIFRSVLYAFAGVAYLVNLFFILMILYYQKTKLIKASQPQMLYFILFGGLLAVGRVIIGGVDITDASCTLGGVINKYLI